MTIEKFAPRSVPFQASPSLREYLDDQMRRLQPLINGAAQLEDDEVITGNWEFTGSLTIPEASVTEHEAALTILETQITDGSLLARVAANETISGEWTFNDDVTIANPATLSFGSSIRQMLNLHGTSYALGVESNTLYFRAGGTGIFRWYQGTADGGSSDIMQLSSTALAVETDLDIDGDADITGSLTLLGNILIDGTNDLALSAAGNSQLSLTSGSANANLDLNAIDDGSGTCTVRIGRSTNTSGINRCTVLRGNNSTTLAISMEGRGSSAAGGALFIAEGAAAHTFRAGQGHLWVKNTTPCQLWFTDDAGNDTQIV